MPGFETITPATLAWIVLVMALSGAMQGALGLGFPTVATPLITMVTDIRTAVVLVLLPCLATVALNLFRGGPMRPVLAQFWMMPIYMLIGAATGTRLFVAYPEFPYALLLAVVIFVYLNLDRLGRTDWPAMQRYRHGYAALFGVMAGVSEGTANVAAPPLIVYYLGIGTSPLLLVQALNLCFFTGKTTQFLTLATAGGVNATQWLVTIPLAAIAAAGAWIGIRLRSRIAAETYRRWLKWALFAIAIVLVAQQVWRWS
ncbi:MAG: TSUP family transporter [Rhodospirillaceae bacterium]